MENDKGLIKQMEMNIKTVTCEKVPATCTLYSSELKQTIRSGGVRYKM
jgi:hypothetical protein